MSSVRFYVNVTAALLTLLVVTVTAAYVHAGAFNTVIAMSISLTKGALIVLFFMHVRQANPLIRIFVCAGVFWLALLFALAMSDFLTRS